jgi:hypothetical protein
LSEASDQISTNKMPCSSPLVAKFWSGFIGGVTRLRTSVTRNAAGSTNI